MATPTEPAEITPEEALSNLEEATGLLKADRQTHFLLINSVFALQRALVRLATLELQAATTKTAA